MFQINIETKCLKMVYNNHLTNRWVKGGDEYDIFEKKLGQKWGPSLLSC